MASRSLIGAGAVVTAALVGIGVGAYASSSGEKGTVELVDVSSTPSPSVAAEPTVEPTATPTETTTTTATVEPEPVVTSVAPPPAPKPAPKEEPVSEPVVEPKPAPRQTFEDENSTTVVQTNPGDVERDDQGRPLAPPPPIPGPPPPMPPDEPSQD